MAVSQAKRRQGVGRSPDVRRRALLERAVLLPALEASASQGRPPRARTTREDSATNPDWRELWWKLDATASGILLPSGGGLLWVRSRLRR